MTVQSCPYQKLPQSSVKKAWAALLTNSEYLPGLLTLVYALKKVGSKYPFVLLYTESLDVSCHEIIDKELDVYKIKLDTLKPSNAPDLINGDSRFHETWSKIQTFGLYGFDRLGVLDADMAVLQNMDELLEDEKVLGLTSQVPLAACHACVCNPYKKPQYPDTWVPDNCAYTQVKKNPKSDILGPSSSNGIGMINGGLAIIKPNQETFNKCMALLNSDKPQQYNFPDQELISEAVDGNWIGLSYKYNALKTLKQIHSDVWNEQEVKNIHYILGPKPWDFDDDEADDGFVDDTETFQYWSSLNKERLREKEKH